MSGNNCLGIPQDCHRYYFYGDHLGSGNVLADTTGGSTQYEADYYPFGGERVITANSNSSNYRFTGKEWDSEDSLNHFLFREYSPRLGRFMSPDPLIGVLSQPQSLNRYAYVINNPSTLVDPLGLCSTDPDAGIDICPLLDWGFGDTAHGGRGVFGCTLDGFDTPCGLVQGALESGAAVNCPECGPGDRVGADNHIYGGWGPTYALETCTGSDAANASCNGATMRLVGYGPLDRGLRAPDFISINLNVGIPWLLNLIGGTVAVNIDRNGNVYFGPGANLGKAATQVSGSVTANWLTQGSIPDPNQLNKFLTKNSFNFTAGYWAGVQGTWTPGSGTAVGGGFVSPQIGVAWTYSWKLFNLGVKW